MGVYQSINSGNEKDIKLLLGLGEDVNAQGGFYGNALQAAAATGKHDVVKLLLDQGADVNSQGGEYGNALQAAASAGSHTVVKLLLAQGANVNWCTVDVQGSSLLHVAVACEDKDTLRILLEAGAGVHMAVTDAFNQTPFHIAAKSDDAEVLQIPSGFLLDSDVQNENSDTCTLLHHATNKTDIDGCTPLHRAVENHAFRAAEWLIAQGAKVDIEDFNKITPFQRASQTKDFAMMSLLFPKVTRGLIKATDWRACLPQGRNRNIILASGGPGMPSV